LTDPLPINLVTKGRHHSVRIIVVLILFSPAKA
jgi:hypothetical protein